MDSHTKADLLAISILVGGPVLVLLTLVVSLAIMSGMGC